MELVIELYVCTDWGQLFKKLVKTIPLLKKWGKTVVFDVLFSKNSNFQPFKPRNLEKDPLFLIVIDLGSALIVIVWAQR
jgi:hypothetical protein